MVYTFSDFAQQFGPIVLTFGWLLVVWMVMWIAWKTYLVLKMVDYVSAIEWTFYQVTLPEETEETPRSMEVIFEVLGGIHKGPDINEKYFDGYLEAWISFEIYCSQQSAKFIIVVPTAHKRLLEGAVYGQYPKADIVEVEDYTQRYNAEDLRKKFEMWGTEIILTEDDIYPIKSYRDFEATMAENIPFVDPMQVLLEAWTNVEPGEEYWMQLLFRPIDGKNIKKWEKRGEQEIAEISGQASAKKPGMWENAKEFMMALPGDLFKAIFAGPLETESKKEEKVLRFFNPSDDAKMKKILEKVSVNGYKTKIRVIHIAPVGQLKKPNISRGAGVFKQFAATNLNSLKPDPDTKTNGPGFFMKDRRRWLKERNILLNFQWRDFFGTDAGKILNAEEIATLYHFPVKYVTTPGVARAKAGHKNPPANLPYA
jgi:hypothetical protein